MITNFHLFESVNDGIILYHSTNSTWTKPEIRGMGFHAGTLKAAKDRMKSFSMKINPHIVKLKMYLENPLNISRDYRFHDSLTKVSSELYKDGIINKKEKENFCQIYSSDSTFENLRKLLHEKYGYDGIVYRNNIEDRGSNSYIAFYPEQIEILDYDYKENSLMTENNKHHEFIRIEKNPYELVHSTGEAGCGIYFSLSKYPQMIKYYKNSTHEGYRVISAHPKKGTIIYDFTKPENLSDLLNYMREEIDKLSKRMTHYIKPKINQSNYQRYGTMIEDYIRRKLNNNVDAFIVNHEGLNLPKGKQLIIINEESFDYEELN